MRSPIYHLHMCYYISSKQRQTNGIQQPARIGLVSALTGRMTAVREVFVLAILFFEVFQTHI